MKEALEQAGASEVARLERNLWVLATIGQIAPLFGLLGTVMGFMTDEVVTNLHAHFSQALIPTALGLAIGIPCYAAYNYLVAEVGGLVMDMEKASLDAVRLVEELLGTYDSLSQVYTCGPPAMIGEVRSTASNLGWPLETIHYEYFKNETVVDALSAFEIDLARSGMTLFVEGGKTILEVLRENGVTLPSSCEQGACGTCEVAVLEGLPHHQDVYLNEAEHAAGDRIMTCISRAHSERLVLDI